MMNTAKNQIRASPTHVCCVCATRFWMDNELYERRITDGRDFYCPNGHAQVFKETRADQLERQLLEERKLHQIQIESQRKRAEWAEQGEKIAQRSAAAFKGQVTKIRKRIAHGVCPCCNRTFGNLAEHMQTKHPEWGDSGSASCA